jgi:hypothetical protein
MKFDHTLEIVTKDIQEIEKLVSNFKNYSRVPNIELGLALTKLQNVYDILLMLRDNQEQETVEDRSEGTLQVDGTGIPEVEPLNGTEITDFEKIVVAEVPKEEKKESTVTPETKKAESIKETPVQENNVSDNKRAAKPRILGENFNEGKGSVYEKIGKQVKRPDIAAMHQSAPIKKISGSIGINDKFFFIRELFHGNAELFRQTLDHLDSLNDLDSATTYLENNFRWDMESEPAGIFMNLIRRKFIAHE